MAIWEIMQVSIFLFLFLLSLKSIAMLGSGTTSERNLIILFSLMSIFVRLSLMLKSRE